MKTINSAFNGFASSLLLNVGLTRAAERFDTVKVSGRKSTASAETCVWQCDFSAETCVWQCDFAADNGK
jgi:hypothetical protein